MAAALLGWLSAAAGLRLLAALPEARLPRLDQIQLDARVLAFTTVVSIAVGIAFGLLPALQASRGELRDSLSDSFGQHGHSRRPPPAERD